NSLLFLVNPKVPANSLAQFVAFAKANPGKLNYASPGAATQTHLVIELFSRKADIKLQHIPYRGGAPAMTAMVAGETQFTAIPTSSPSSRNTASRRPAGRQPTFSAPLPAISRTGRRQRVAQTSRPSDAPRDQCKRQRGYQPNGLLRLGRSNGPGRGDRCQPT